MGVNPAMSSHVLFRRTSRLTYLLFESLRIRSANSLETKSAGLISPEKNFLSFGRLPSGRRGVAGPKLTLIAFPSLDFCRIDFAYGSHVSLGNTASAL